MDDVLISNLPTTWLQSSLRLLISQGTSTQKPFVQHIRNRIHESPPPFPNAQTLFPEPTIVSNECHKYLALTRCIFSSKLAEDALPYLTHFIRAIVQRRAIWSSQSELKTAVLQFDGDTVQAVQALKESRPDLTAELEGRLEDLLSSFRECAAYCESRELLRFPFSRAERQVRDVLYSLCAQSGRPKGEEAEIPAPSLSLSLSEHSKKVETFKLGPINAPRLLNGLWQLSSPAWGSSTSEQQEQALAQLVEAGLTMADMADHYGDAELIYGEFRNKLMPGLKGQVLAATKWCVFSKPQQAMTEDWVLRAVHERSRRLGGRVELLQFHWYDYEDKGYLEILTILVSIARRQPQLVSAIGLCNFDAAHTAEACEYILERTGSVGLVSNQVQAGFSLLDSRPLHDMYAVCQRYGLKLLTYGSLCGGFLSPKWLNRTAPDLYSTAEQLTPSQRKYFDIISVWGGWADFQRLLSVLDGIAVSHGVTLTNVATRWVLQQPHVGAVIVGTRLGVSIHGNDNLSVFDFALSEAEVAAINCIALGERKERSRALFERLGDCGNEYRAMH
ncbi:hypothetical protein D0864_01570 [Hortaea werneckii]|uniref:NADP-dependent oxidoreductase domain-containing protein n=1 Tax=Hortaea werneckii TaxID=91943 RepID=A0A3M7H7A6_HORWE|nr:hypothetical protein D0864_01570 [Hortaea werneckii]